jgi:hypothetical protein
VAALTRQLADPAVYEDGERVKALVADHGAAKDRAASLMDEWERAQLALEEAEAEVEASLRPLTLRRTGRSGTRPLPVSDVRTRRA